MYPTSSVYGYSGFSIDAAGVRGNARYYGIWNSWIGLLIPSRILFLNNFDCSFLLK